jgi:hypothetical protein
MSNHSPQHDSAPVSNLQPPTPVPEDRCTHTSADGRRCVLIRAATNYPFCVYHAMDESLPDRGRPRRSLSATQRGSAQMFERPEDDVTADLLGPIHDFRTGAAINHALGKLVILLAGNRISPRRAAVLAYTFQLLLQSVSEVKTELKVTHNYDAMDEEVCRVLEETAPLREKPSRAKAGAHAKASSHARASD